jgi:hypothetical protein
LKPHDLPIDSMKRGANGALTYAPTDLIRFMQSPFAIWMDRFLLERPDELAPDEEDVQKQLIAGEGEKHEQAYLDRLVSEGVALVEIDKKKDFAAAAADPFSTTGSWEFTSGSTGSCFRSSSTFWGSWRIEDCKERLRPSPRKGSFSMGQGSSLSAARLGITGFREKSSLSITTVRACRSAAERSAARIRTRWTSAERCEPASWPKSLSAKEWKKPARRWVGRPGAMRLSL